MSGEQGRTHPEHRTSFDAGSVSMEHIGYQPEYTLIAQHRKNLRTIMDTLWFEALTIILVMVYAVILFTDMATAAEADVDPEQCYGIMSREDQMEVIEQNKTLTADCELVEERGVLYVLDFTFLSIFVVEIIFRLLGYGVSFLRDPVQFIDAIVVTTAFVINLLPSDTVATGGQLLNLLRVIRLLRIAVIINRLQRSRDAAAMRSKRAMYRRLGAPVEKVLAFLTDLRSRQRSQRDQYNIDWMMEVIASDELYAVVEFDEDTLLQGAGGDATAASDMARFVSAETGFGRRRAQSFDIDGEKGEGGEGGEGDNKSFNNGGGAAGGVGNSFVGGRRSSPSENMKQLWAGAAIASSSLNIKLQRLVSPAEAWAFDIFDYELACSSLPEPGTGRCATLLCYYLLEQHGVLDSLSIERQKLLAWLTRVEDAYPSSNPYHNSLHAADVCANIDYFLRQGNLSRCLSPIDYLSALIAAVVHDMRHPGVNNTFLEASHDELAVTYNDVSVLENHHVASAFKLLKDEEYDWTKALSPEDYKDLRETVILMILGTDMRAHFEHLTKFKSKLAGDGFKAEHVERKDSRLLLTVALHAADIANPAKPQPIATAWARRSMEEFFRQGDREAELGLPVSPFMDRSKAPLAATIVNCQIGFINVLVRPLLTEWASFLGAEAERDIVVTLGATLRLWETSGAKVIDSWGDFGSAPSGGGKADAALLPDKAGAAVAAAGAGKKAARTVSSTESRLSDRSVESMSKRSGSIQQKL